MQIPLKWINELVNIEIVELDELVKKLTLGGFEVEEIIELGVDTKKQIALDISSTANRSDSLSIQGISMEIAILLDEPLKVSQYSFSDNHWRNNFESFTTNVPAEHNCSIFLAVTIDNLTNITTPKWLREKLESSGISPSNDLLDFQNYILLETGYPFAFYDANKISSKLNTSKFQFSISTADSNQKFYANDNTCYKLDSDILLVNVNEEPISIAGMIENKDFAYSKETNSLLVEASIFNSTKIRQQSRALGLRTERSGRYEKSLKNNYLIESLYKLIALLKITNPNLNCKLHTFNKIEQELLKPILLRYETINEILGPINNPIEQNFNYITKKTVSNYLERFNFKFLYDESKVTWEVQIPQSRSDDLTREIDLIEEIGRLHGFNNFLTTLPRIKAIGSEDLSYRTRKKITACLLNLGLNELIQYSLVSQTTVLNNEIRLINPLLSDCSYLRSSLLPSLIQTVQENLKQGNSFIEGFEYGHVFSSGSKSKFKEKEYIAGIFGGIETKLAWSDSKRALTWFEAKGKIEQFLKQLNLSTYWETLPLSSNSNLLHPYRSSKIYLSNGSSLGIFGQIHPILANTLNIFGNVYLFEFDIEFIQNQIGENKLTIYKDYSVYPKIVKSLSLIIRKDIKFSDIQKILYWNGTKFLSEINLLDEYRAKSIPEGFTSLCLELVFQSKEKTLQNKEIEKIISKLELVLHEKFGTIIKE